MQIERHMVQATASLPKPHLSQLITINQPPAPL